MESGLLSESEVLFTWARISFADERSLGGRTGGLPMRKHINGFGCNWLVSWLAKSRADLQEKGRQDPVDHRWSSLQHFTSGLWIPTTASSAARPRGACKNKQTKTAVLNSDISGSSIWEDGAALQGRRGRDDKKWTTKPKTLKGLCVTSHQHFPKHEFLQIWRLVGGGGGSLLVSASPENPPLKGKQLLIKGCCSRENEMLALKQPAPFLTETTPLQK